MPFKSERESAAGGIVVVTLSGVLDLVTMRSARTVIGKALAEHPPAVVVDLSGLTIADERAIPVFASAARQSLAWPATRLLLVCADRETRAVLVRNAVPRFLPVLPSRTEALAPDGPPLPRRYAVTAVGTGPAASRTARSFVQTCCRDWALPRRAADTAALLAEELVANADRHGGGAHQLRVEAGRRYLTVAVSDTEPRPPRLIEGDDPASAGRGMQLIEQLAANWGVEPSADGKIVWCAVALSPPIRRRSARPAGPRTRSSSRPPLPPELVRERQLPDLSEVHQELMQDLLAAGVSLGQLTRTNSDPASERRLTDLADQLDVAIRRLRRAAFEQAIAAKGRTTTAAMADPESVPAPRSGSDITADTEREQQWQHRALHDPLTGLPNRALLHDRLGHAIAVAARNPTSLAVLLVDLNDFKTVNDQYGHTVGDAVLREVAHRLASNVRAADTIGRWGGDEFLVIAEQLDSETTAYQLADRLAASLHAPIPVGDHCVPISASMGVAHYENTHDPDNLIQAADQALNENRSSYG